MNCVYVSEWTIDRFVLDRICFFVLILVERRAKIDFAQIVFVTCTACTIKSKSFCFAPLTDTVCKTSSSMGDIWSSNTIITRMLAKKTKIHTKTTENMMTADLIVIRQAV